jgi:hypothetical protein
MVDPDRVYCRQNRGCVDSEPVCRKELRYVTGEPVVPLRQHTRHEEEDVKREGAEGDGDHRPDWCHNHLDQLQHAHTGTDAIKGAEPGKPGVDDLGKVGRRKVRTMVQQWYGSELAWVTLSSVSIIV